MIYIEIKETGAIGVQKGPIAKGMVLVELAGKLITISVSKINIIGR